MAVLISTLVACASPPSTYVIPMEAHTVQGYPPTEKFPLKVSLRLPQELRAVTWNVHYLGPVSLGMQLAHNAETLARQLFSHVVVGPGESFDAILTPRLAYSEQVRKPAFSSDPHLLAIGLEWTLATPKGVVIWTDTARGEWTLPLPSSSEYRVPRVLDVTFWESFTSMSSARAIREFSAKKSAD